MGNSPFKELFGECSNSNALNSSCAPKDNQEKCSVVEVKKTRIQETKGFRNSLSFYLSAIVVCLTFLISVWYVNKGTDDYQVIPEVKSVTDFRSISTEDTLLDSFVSEFIKMDYKVKTSGSFAYLYEDSEDDVKKNGLISMGNGDTYFKNGSLLLFDTEEEFKVLWDIYDRKNILLKEKLEYFLVTNSSDFYYKHYLGQHILEDLINDYLKNRDFINQVDENTWDWEWSFYTPVEGTQKHKIKTEILVDSETGYVSEISLSDGSSKVCVFEFEIEPLNTEFDVLNELLDYKRIDEDEFNLSS